MEVTRLFDILDNYKEQKPGQNVALAHKVEGKWVTYSIQDYVDYVNNVSYGLLALGIQPGDKIGIVSGNRPEWNFLDMGAMQIGAIPVPIYPTISQEEYRYILNHAEMKILFVEGKSLRSKIEPILPELEHLKELFTFVDQKCQYRYFEQLVTLGKENPQPEKVAKLKANVKSSELATIIYTSGTTGNPKGVMLSHDNIMLNVKNVQELFLPTCEKALSFLPLCHAYERMLMYTYQFRQVSIYYSDLACIGDNLKEIHPNVMCCVPRLLEKMYEKLYSAGKKQSFLTQKIYYWAVAVAKKYNLDPEKRSWYYNIKWAIANKLIYNKWRDALGIQGPIQVVSGGSALQAQLASFFQAIGFYVFEGYGLSETSPVISVAREEPFTHEPGPVGLPLPGVEVRIDPATNELLCRGHNVMLGYYKAPEMTAEVIDKDGWFHTGDTARITEKGLVVITGRIKSLFKTSFGKYVNPEHIENKVVTSPFVGSIVVVGENRQFTAALIVPDFMCLETWCKSHKVPFTSKEQVVKEPEVLKRFRKEITKYNAHFADYEQIKRFVLIPEEWTTQNGKLSPTLKVKRKVVQKEYEKEIEGLFSKE